MLPTTEQQLDGSPSLIERFEAHRVQHAAIMETSRTVVQASRALIERIEKDDERRIGLHRLGASAQ